MARGFDLDFARASTRFGPPQRVLSAALSLALYGCPQQELAPLLPCTVSVVSVEASQTGTDKVDLLFVIDNSGSMSEEQVKINNQLDHLVQVLTTGDFDGMPNANGELDFKPVGSLRLGVTSVDLGANGVTGLRSCGSNAYLPTEQNIGAQGADSVNRPFGDDGLLLNDTSVAVTGVSVLPLGGALGGTPQVAIAPRPECNVQVPRLLEYPSGGSAAQIAAEFGCVAELGVNGCNFEQQLESTWKAVAPNTDRSFSRASGGQGTAPGLNAGFLREDAILAIILVTDEEDCSAPDTSSQALLGSLDILTVNDLCGSRPDLLHPVKRYIDGLKSLKSAANQDLIIFAGIVGVPLAGATRGQTLDQILARPDMQYTSFLGQARPACTAAGNAGTATPARRIVQVAQGFAENGVITSICENDYGGALDAVIAKIAGKLSGQCLPRSLRRNAEGKVDCRVVEIKAAGDRTPCDPARGRIRQLPDRSVNGSAHVVCEVQQLQVQNRTEPMGVGWYYDDFSNAALNCQTNRQRIAFTTQAAVQERASARFECFQSVAAATTLKNVRGVEAIGTSCADDGSNGPRGDAKCRALNTADAHLSCVNGLCQLSCMTDADCPPAYVCNATAGAAGYCENPTCPLESAGL